MVSLIKNKAVQALSLSTFFQVLGMSFFNIILLLLAKDTENETFWVAVVSIGASIPGVLSMVLGRVAGKFKNKTSWMIKLTLLQSVMYVFLSGFCNMLTDVIVIALVINLVSDIVGMLVALIRMTIIQNKIKPELRQQTLGLNQSIGLTMQPLGQAMGLAYIDLTGNYAVGSMVNAGTFLISAMILFLYRDSLRYESRDQEKNDKPVKQNLKAFYKQTIQVFGDITGLPIVHLMLALVLLNAIGAGVDGILNLYVLEEANISPFPFGVTILLINMVYVVGSIAGSLIVNDCFKQTSYKNLILLAVAILTLLFIAILLNLGIVSILIFMFGLTYIMGKINPKLYAMLMEKTDASTLSGIIGVLNSSLTFAAPIGAIVLVGGYPIIGKTNTVTVCLGVMLITFILIVTGRKKVTEVIDD